LRADSPSSCAAVDMAHTDGHGDVRRGLAQPARSLHRSTPLRRRPDRCRQIRPSRRGRRVRAAPERSSRADRFRVAETRRRLARRRRHGRRDRPKVRIGTGLGRRALSARAALSRAAPTRGSRMRCAHSMPFGAEISAGGTRFALWAPVAIRVDVEIDGESPRPMERRDDGFHVLTVPNAAAGRRYAYRVDGRRVPDPASRFNPEGVEGPSEIVDPRTFDWHDEPWAGRPWHEAVLYELHVGAFTAEGTFAAAAERLPYLAELGVTAIALMPIADGPGERSWGYDAVLPYAIRPAYGRPPDLKSFVQAAHREGLMVLLDVVYNHFGPAGNYLPLYAPQFFTARHKTPWGDAI